MLLILIKKFLGRPHPTESDESSIENKVIRVQAGDTLLRNALISDYQPYIAKVTSRFCKRYIDPGRDDEFSIALVAFNEAMDKFSLDGGSSFLSFADTVIRRRLIDYVRREQRHTSQIPYSAFEVEDDEDNTINPVEIHQSIEQYELEKTIEERGFEITDLNLQLADFGITFLDLVDASPKHTDSRELILSIALKLSRDQGMMDTLFQKKMLPIKELLEVAEVSRKTLERNRKFIIAVALIHNGSFPYLQDYLHLSNDDEGRGEK